MITTVVPPRTERVTVCARHAVGNRKCQVSRDISGFILGINGARNDTDPLC